MSKQYIVSTRPREKSSSFTNQLKTLGYRVLECPSITIKKSVLTEKEKQTLQEIASFDWIIFTSQNGVPFFLNELKDLGIDRDILKTKHIAAVGPTTAQALIKNNLPVSFIPTSFTVQQLGKQLPKVKNKKILLPRANIANPILVEEFRKRGANVVSVCIYTTLYTNSPMKRFTELLQKHQIAGITFTSPSTVKGFLKNIQQVSSVQSVHLLPAFSIGPQTTQVLMQSGFTNIHTAEIYTLNGIFEKIKERRV